MASQSHAHHKLTRLGIAIGALLLILASAQWSLLKASSVVPPTQPPIWREIQDETQTAVANTATAVAQTGTDTALTATSVAASSTNSALTATATSTPSSTPSSTPTATATKTATPTITLTPTPDRNLYTDRFEPNDNLTQATLIQVRSSRFGAATPTPGNCTLTLWPLNESDFFKFYTTPGMQYDVYTKIENPGLNTYMRLYNPQGKRIAENDNDPDTGFSSRISFTSGESNYFYAEVINIANVDPVNLSYCIDVVEYIPPTPTPTQTPTTTPTPTATVTRTPTATIAGDAKCEPNERFETACLMVGNERKDYNFAPPYGSGKDLDYYRMYVKRGLSYTCTTSVSGATDTTMIVYHEDRQLIGKSEDISLTNWGSQVAFYAYSNQYIYIFVEPFVVPPIEEAESYRYSLECVYQEPTATPEPTATLEPTATPEPSATLEPLPTVAPSQTVAPSETPYPSATPNWNATATARAIASLPPTSTPRPSGGGGGGVIVRTPTFTPTPEVTETVTPTPSPTVGVRPIPTVVPTQIILPTVNLTVLIYYDQNNNFTPETNEGIMDVVATLHDNSTGQLLAYGYTNDAGVVRFGPYQVTGSTVRLSVPYLNFVQIVPVSTTNVQIRVAPQQLPGVLP